MGRALILTSYSATQPNTGLAATAFTGDSLVVMNDTRKDGSPRILAHWGFNQVEGWHQLVWNSAHDQLRNFRPTVEAASPLCTMGMDGIGMDVQPQETITATIAGSNTSGDVEIGQFLTYYPDLPGVDQNMIDYADLVRRGTDQITVQCTLAGSGAGYSGSELINAESNLLKANRDYAVLGIRTDTPVASLNLRSPDTGNFRLGVAGSADHADTMSNWFISLSRIYNLPLIPIVQAGNVNNTYLDVAMNENAGSTVISVILRLLSD